MWGLEIKTKARNWVKQMESRYVDEIKYSVEHSVVEENFDGLERFKGLEKRFDQTKVFLMDCTVEQAIINASKMGKKICVLNFASYKSPGGKFYDGAMAQEEALCHASTLYPVLKQFNHVYVSRKNKLNTGLYNEDFIYSPDIVFPTGAEDIKVDVLTYAAPNMIRRPKTDDYYKVFHRRIINAFTYPYLQGADVIILGAWGCGVFCNDPEYVSEIWDMCTYYLNGYYDTVIHPVPNLGKSGSRNYNAFDEHIKFNRV